VRGINSAIPILFMTARDDFPSKQRGYQIGIDDYMVKPIDVNELMLHIGALLRRANIQNLLCSDFCQELISGNHRIWF